MKRSKFHSGIASQTLVMILAVVFAVGVGTVYFFQKEKAYPNPFDVACTQEAKLCPNGSAVGRVGPNCEFTQCPKSSQSQVDISTWKTYQSKDFGFEFKYPPMWTIKHWKGGGAFYVCDEKRVCGPFPEGISANFTISVGSNEGLGLEQYVLSPARGEKIVRYVTLGDERAIVTVSSYTAVGQYLGENLWVTKGQFIYHIGSGYQGKTVSIEESFGTILATFKFIN